MSDAAKSVLRAVGELADSDINLSETALALSALDRPELEFGRYRKHIRELESQVIAARTARIDVNGVAFILQKVIANVHGYYGDTETYQDPANADYASLIDRKKGLPVTLGILYIHVGRAAGWRVNGTRFPGHFLIRIDREGDLAIVDPFRGGEICSQKDLRDLIPRTSERYRSFSDKFLDCSGNREILLRLLNNLRIHAIQKGSVERVIEILDRMLLVAPKSPLLCRELTLLKESQGNLTEAITACRQYLAYSSSQQHRIDADDILNRLNRLLN